MEKLLKQFNFSDREIIVYKTLLKLGGALVSEIARKTGIKRTSCQEYIRSIEEKGFINSSKKGNKYFYQAEDPDRFRQIIHERMFAVDRLLNQLRGKEKKEKWKVRSIKENEMKRIVKSEEKRGKIILKFRSKDADINLVGDDKIVLSSQKEEIEGVEIISNKLVLFHKDITKKLGLKKKKTKF